MPRRSTRASSAPTAGAAAASRAASGIALNSCASDAVAHVHAQGPAHSKTETGPATGGISPRPDACFACDRSELFVRLGKQAARTSVDIPQARRRFVSGRFPWLITHRKISLQTSPSNSPTITLKPDPPLSEYERLRLERIKANAELLSKLGLEALPFER